MKSEKVNFTSIDEYIATFPAEVRNILEDLRAAIHAAAPGAQEKISYQMPAFALHGNLVYFAAWKNHVGLYGASSALREFGDELAVYAGPKGNYQFPLDQPLPLELIGRVVRFRVAENLKKAGPKA
ncbi:MAG: DUF1801 domain-containing protein [Chloroflexi bacterium]|nr:DUF1801 domain-containing protein [Chloroflexota bacterium]